MSRLFVIIPAWLLVMTIGLITYRWIADSAPTSTVTNTIIEMRLELNEQRERIQILEKHLDSTGL